MENRFRQPHMKINATLSDNAKAVFGNCNIIDISNKGGGVEIQKKKNASEQETHREDIEETNKVHKLHGFEYKMKAGFVILIHNTCFAKRKDAWRKGSEVDAKALQKFFKIDCGFEFRQHNDLKAEEMLRLARDYSEKDYSKYDSLFVVVLSHGNQEGILGVDEQPIAIDALTGAFTAENCQSLANKPKSFFIQACRGDKDDQGAIVTDASMSSPPLYQIPIESDFLIAYSSPPGYTSFRDVEKGSWFIKTLVRVFSDCSEEEHLMDMLLRVNFIIAKILSTENLKQMPLQECRLTKKCYFCK